MTQHYLVCNDNMFNFIDYFSQMQKKIIFVVDNFFRQYVVSMQQVVLILGVPGLR
jgi:hypothetical protein